MAEILLAAVLRKLSGFTIEKVLQLSEVNEPIETLRCLQDITKEVAKLKNELSWIHALMKDVDSRCIIDQTQMKWLKDVIDIAYQIEDVVDIFIMECPTADDGTNSRPKKISLPFLAKFRKEMGKAPKKISSLPFLNNFRKEIQNITEKIVQVSEYMKRYNIKSMDLNIRGQNKQSDSALDLAPIEDPDLVGFDKHVKNIVKNLCDENKYLAVVSIVGPGGIGKTALARKVCYSKEVREVFGETAWITISQRYDLFGVLGKIAKGFGIESPGLDLNKLAIKIAEHLKGRRYLIVLDDVWTKELWIQLERVLLNTHTGSRVLMTTRLTDVARSADPTYEPYELKYLNGDESLQLFLKTAIPKSQQNSNGSSPYPLDLTEIIVKKCKGLPIALICLGRLLSSRANNDNQWKKFLTTMSWQDDGFDHCSKVLASSFEYLPFERKFCFMYFAAFPEDQDIEAQPLLRMWIAEGLIPQGQRTLVETAERFLEDLVQRSMVQVSERYPGGSIKYIRIHDILRDLAVQKAMEFNFLTICSAQDDWVRCKMARRVAVHYSDSNESITRDANPNLRSLLIFGESKVDCSNCKLLRVLANVDKEVELLSFQELPHLRYLQLNNKGGSTNDFEEWIKAMKSIETLSLRSTFEILNFEGTFSVLNNLKHLEIKSMHEGSGSILQLKENMLSHLVDLHLQGFEFDSDPMPVLEKLGSLEILKISSSNKSRSLKISCSAEGFKQLERLTLQNIEMLEEWEIATGAMPKLYWLDVSGCDKLPVPAELMHHESLQVLRWHTDLRTEVDKANAIELIKIYEARPDVAPK